MDTARATHYFYSREATSDKKSHRLHEKFRALILELKEKYCLVDQRHVQDRRMQFEFLHPTLPATRLIVRFEINSDKKEGHFFKTRFIKVKKTTKITINIISFSNFMDDPILEEIIERYNLQREEHSHYQDLVINQVQFHPLHL